MKFSVVIPARYGSTRLPGKALADIGGIPMVQHVYEQASRSAAQRVIVATDDQRIAEALSNYNSDVLMTSKDHPSGTDRLVEVSNLLDLEDSDIVVNVQGDEPLIPPQVIDQVAANLIANEDCICATLSEPIMSCIDFLNPSIVKVVSDGAGRALYFSRAPVPWSRDHIDAITAGDDSVLQTLNAQRHIGIYAYRVSLLKQFQHWPPAPLEQTESLEQLRILDHGERIHVAPASAPVPGGVDTPEDLQEVRNLWDKNHS